MAYSAAREGLLTLNQNDAWRTTGIGDFLKGEYRPGLDKGRKLESPSGKQGG